MNEPQIFIEELLQDPTLVLAIAGSLLAILVALVVWDFRRRRKGRWHRHRHHRPRPPVGERLRLPFTLARSVWKLLTRRIRSRARQRARDEAAARQMRRLF